ncbi:MAG: hypothetical protein IKZ87_07640 [Actinomycetaceae bacterium]|nr:hypothetical protein [Actinomycetaceae bacterium]
MLFDVMVALMFIGVIALLLVGLVVLVVKKLLRVHKEEGGKPVATAKRVGVFALGGLAALAGAVGGIFDMFGENRVSIANALYEEWEAQELFGWY